jgi:two-component system, cell cycle response regulator DivK
VSQKHHILIVDDDHDTHIFIADLLEMYGYKADCIHSADAALELIRREPPDFLILDLHIDRPYAGWILLQQLRTNPATAAIPAVLATSDRDFVRGEREAIRAHGADALEKPFEVDALLKIVESTLGGA